LSDRFVKDPAAIVKVYQKVTVWVKEVDVARKRIGLTMKDPEAKQPEKPAPKEPRPRPQVRPKPQGPGPALEHKQAGPSKDRPAHPKHSGKPFKDKRQSPPTPPKGEEPFGERLGLLWPSN
jgi:transcriptional accessory protein Tex/SPT6